MNLKGKHFFVRNMENKKIESKIMPKMEIYGEK